MRFTVFAGVFALSALPFAAQAEFAGGRVGVSHSFLTSETDFAKSSIDGQIEWTFGSRFLIQTDLGYSGLHALDENALNMTNHLGMSFGDGSAVGLFYGWDKIEGSEDFWGAEYARTLGAAQVEAYLGAVDEPGSNGTIAGIAARIPVADAFGMGVSVDHISSHGVADATRFGIGADYMLGSATMLKGEIGRMSADDSAASIDETYLKLGVDFKFGPNGGTTFGTRSLFNALPGL